MKQNKTLDMKLFENPPKEFRAAPFWAWNDVLSPDTLQEQIKHFKEMGFGGFHIHARSGLATPYLKEDFMDMVLLCNKTAGECDMLTYLYDEDRWPSGFAGGYVTKNPRYRARKLLLTQKPLECTDSETAAETGEPCFLAAYDVVLDKDGYLDSYSKIAPDSDACGKKWYAYLTADKPGPRYNNQTYVDTLSKEAISEFVNITHETYKKHLGNEFGKSVVSIFTDEPHFSTLNRFGFSQSTEDVTIPWSPNIEMDFEKKYGFDILAHLPELFWESKNSESLRVRYCFIDFISELFAENYSGTIGKWCAENNIAMTGHLLAEDSLYDQSINIGDAMRNYKYFSIPGIDMLGAFQNFSTAKQAQSVARQSGKPGIMSELYGVTNWDFDFRGHKFHGDWQAALGVTLRVPHLSWYSMRGAAKRDYPASISYQSPWYKEYSYVEDHFARLNTVLTRGKPVVRVGVIHPVESLWGHLGPNDLTGEAQKKIEKRFSDITNWLLEALIDFDYINESLLPEQCTDISGLLSVGEMQYSTVIVPACETLRSTTVSILMQFINAGGNVIYAGNAPCFTDAIPGGSATELYSMAVHCPFDKEQIVTLLEKDRDVSIHTALGSRADNFLYNMKKDFDCTWLFIAHSKVLSHNWTRGSAYNVPDPDNVLITIKGEHTPVLYDTITGTAKPIPYKTENCNTIIEYTLYEQDSLLIKLDKYTGKSSPLPAVPLTVSDTLYLTEPAHYTLSEPNVCLLDIAEFSIDDAEFEKQEEILRIDAKVKAQLGFAHDDTQPWAIHENPSKHKVSLKFRFKSNMNISDAKLALENAETAQITLNGAPVSNCTDGYFADHAIKTVCLPGICIGENELIVSYPVNERSHIEALYILGNFGVGLCGIHKTLCALPERLSFTSITHQKLPFYGANITYKTKIRTPHCSAQIRLSDFKGAAVRLFADGVDKGLFAYSPYKITIDDLTEGEHTLEFTFYGNRFNTFGFLHNSDGGLWWYGENAWYSKDASWCYEYRLKETGILSGPVIEITKL